MPSTIAGVGQPATLKLPCMYSGAPNPAAAIQPPPAVPLRVSDFSAFEENFLCRGNTASSFTPLPLPSPSLISRACHTLSPSRWTSSLIPSSDGQALARMALMTMPPTSQPTTLSLAAALSNSPSPAQLRGCSDFLPSLVSGSSCAPPSASDMRKPCSAASTTPPGLLSPK